MIGDYELTNIGETYQPASIMRWGIEVFLMAYMKSVPGHEDRCQRTCRFCRVAPLEVAPDSAQIWPVCRARQNFGPTGQSVGRETRLAMFKLQGNLW